MTCFKCKGETTYLGSYFTKFEEINLVVFIRKCPSCNKYSVSVTRAKEYIKPKNPMPPRQYFKPEPTEDEIRINNESIKKQKSGELDYMIRKKKK